MKKLFSLSIVLAGAGISLAPFAAFAPAAQAIYYERTPGSYACRNSLDPQCENPTRDFESEKWICKNNPGPDCAEPPRVDQELARGAWVCRNNQNVVSCQNPIRYSVPDSELETWPTYFPAAE
ncbi:MAG: hypothetical protein MUF72_00680 [Elainella sp. Prado103]|jgi:hypothetical protein|nr:hypothetical protein [Elainella sp. Prado103]